MNYNIFDLNYNNNLTKIDSTPGENQELQNIFTKKVPSSLVGSLRDGRTLEDIEDIAFTGELITDRIDTQAAQILDEWTFGSSGAIKISPDDTQGVWISPDGIVGRDSNGDATVTIPTDGSGPTFSGELQAASGRLGNSTNYIEFDGTNINIETPDLFISNGDASFSGTLSTGISIESPEISGGTITGGLFRTANSGERIVIESDPTNIVKFLHDDFVIGSLSVDYDTDTDEGELLLAGGYGSLKMFNFLGVSEGSGFVLETSGGGMKITGSGKSNQGNLSFKSDNPNDNENDEAGLQLNWYGGDWRGTIGAEFYKYTDVGESGAEYGYLDIITGQIIADGNILPNTSSDTIGDSSHDWDKIYTNDIDVSGNLDVNGKIDMDGNDIEDVRCVYTDELEANSGDIDVYDNISMNDYNIEGIGSVVSQNVLANDLYINTTDRIKVDGDGYLYI